jgi:hypothetical protein
MGYMAEQEGPIQNKNKKHNLCMDFAGRPKPVCPRGLVSMEEERMPDSSITSATHVADAKAVDDAADQVAKAYGGIGLGAMTLGYMVGSKAWR